MKADGKDTTMGPWIVQKSIIDPDCWDVLGRNKDAGKQGVSYSGELFMVARGIDSEPDARLIAAAPEMAAFVRRAVASLSKDGRHNSEERMSDLATIARALLARLGHD